MPWGCNASWVWEATRRPGHGLHRLDDASAASLIPFIKSTVSEGALVRTDGWAGYLPLSRHGYRHRPTSLRATRLPAHVVMPGMEDSVLSSEPCTNAA
ncbi:MAG: transposase [Gemmatimonadetes bacterium]|nr:transposase [Gemmatimonadota bacterium]